MIEKGNAVPDGMVHPDTEKDKDAIVPIDEPRCKREAARRQG